MNREKIAELYRHYELTKDDVFKHKHYLIVTRSGIEKIQAKEGLKVAFEVIRCEPDFAVVKAMTKDMETFGSAKYGDYKTGNVSQWYIIETAEKRALSRIVLKTVGFYQLGVFGEDESEEFQKTNNNN